MTTLILTTTFVFIPLMILSFSVASLFAITPRIIDIPIIYSAAPKWITIAENISYPIYEVGDTVVEKANIRDGLTEYTIIEEEQLETVILIQDSDEDFLRSFVQQILGDYDEIEVGSDEATFSGLHLADPTVNEFSFSSLDDILLPDDEYENDFQFGPTLIDPIWS